MAWNCSLDLKSAVLELPINVRVIQTHTKKEIGVIYVTDLLSSINMYIVYSSTCIVADDIAIYCAMVNSNDHLQLQQGLNTVSEWCTKPEMKINIKSELV